jgi:type II secretory pathway pseudopilin PulG
MQEKFVQMRSAGRRVTRFRQQCGFSILEMLLASVIMMVGIISVVQLVPASLQLNANNRLDTLATVIAQRELDQMVSQPLSVDTFLDTDGRVISLGGPNSPGATLAIDPQTLAPQIDFSANAVTGFSIPAYVDKNDPNGATFDVRWAVIPQVASGKTISRRIIIGCRKTNATGSLQLPVTLDTWVHK